MAAGHSCGRGERRFCRRLHRHDSSAASLTGREKDFEVKPIGMSTTRAGYRPDTVTHADGTVSPVKRPDTVVTQAGATGSPVHSATWRVYGGGGASSARSTRKPRSLTVGYGQSPIASDGAKAANSRRCLTSYGLLPFDETAAAAAWRAIGRYRKYYQGHAGDNGGVNRARTHARKHSIVLGGSCAYGGGLLQPRGLPVSGCARATIHACGRHGGRARPAPAPSVLSSAQFQAPGAPSGASPPSVRRRRSSGGGVAPASRRRGEPSRPAVMVAAGPRRRCRRHGSGNATRPPGDARAMNDPRLSDEDKDRILGKFDTRPSARCVNTPSNRSGCLQDEACSTNQTVDGGAGEDLEGLGQGTAHAGGYEFGARLIAGQTGNGGKSQLSGPVI